MIPASAQTHLAGVSARPDGRHHSVAVSNSLDHLACQWPVDGDDRRALLDRHLGGNEADVAEFHVRIGADVAHPLRLAPRRHQVPDAFDRGDDDRDLLRLLAATLGHVNVALPPIRTPLRPC